MMINKTGSITYLHFVLPHINDVSNSAAHWGEVVYILLPMGHDFHPLLKRRKTIPWLLKSQRDLQVCNLPETPMRPSSNISKSSHSIVSKQIHSNKEENNINDASFIHLMTCNTLEPRGGLAIWTFWRSPERPSIQRPLAWLVHHQRKSVR